MLTINELKELIHLPTIEFFSLSSKLSKKNFIKYFPEKCAEYFINDLSLHQMRRYHSDNLYKFYIDNLEKIKKNPQVLLDFIGTLDSNKKKSLTKNTILSTYPEVYDLMFSGTKENTAKYQDNLDYYISGVLKGSTFKNKQEIIKEIINYLGDKAKEDYDAGVKITYIIRKLYFKEDIDYRCSSCNVVVSAYETSKQKQCKDCYKKNKAKNSSSDKKARILQNTPEHISYISGDFYSEDFYSTEFKVHCSKCNKEGIYFFKSKERVLQCPYCDESKSITKNINELFNNIFLLNNRTFIKPKELDFLNHEHKLAIEYNGLMFHSFGSSEHSKFNKPIIDKNYHLNKTELVEEQEYQLLHIFENEWLNEQKQIYWIKIIENKLNFQKLDYEIDQINYNNAKNFIENNSLKDYNLNENMIFLCSYINNNINIFSLLVLNVLNEKDYEIVYFSDFSNSIANMLQYFEKEYSPSSLSVTLDRRYCHQRTWEELGFKLKEQTEPNGYYFKKSEYFNLKDESIEDLFKEGYRIFYDCGEQIYVKYY